MSGAVSGVGEESGEKRQKARQRRAGGCEECASRSPHKLSVAPISAPLGEVLGWDSLFTHAQLLGFLINLPFRQK